MRDVLKQRAFACVVVALVLSACAGAPQRSATTRAPAVNLSGYSASFKQGYAQGCESVRASRQRDEGRYVSDTDYMMGWNDGYSVCGRRQP
ncbi:MAG TPA: hypothetical protein VLN59_09620 [Burkholderiales bacterium]|nr:hypothetical protein [Burkholderiales bacterium]